MYCPNTTVYPMANRDISVFIQEFFVFLNFLRRYWRPTSAALLVYHTFVSVFIPRVPLMQCRSLHFSIAVCLDQHFHSFFSVFPLRTQNLIAGLCSTLILMLLVLIKWPLTLKWRHMLMWCHWRPVKIWGHTVLKFGNDIGSDASDRHHFRRDTSLRFVTFWAEHSFMNTIRVSNSWDPNQARHIVRPDLGPDCLQKLSVHVTVGKELPWPVYNFGSLKVKTITFADWINSTQIAYSLRGHYWPTSEMPFDCAFVAHFYI